VVHYGGEVSSGQLALTFDDGPHPEGTPAVLSVLERHGLVATFFLLASAAREHAALVRAVVDGGHEVALHADVHTALDRLPIGVVARRLAAARDEVERVAGPRPVPLRFHRPPFGRLSWRTLQAVRRIGLEVAMWTHDPGDWRDDLASDSLEANLAASLVGGAVVLLHDGASTGVATAAALDAVLSTSSSASPWPRAVRLSELV
jgi:peptidoglycan/xylan/chitin deacetylase (PgdA/CDA1 family)